MNNPLLKNNGEIELLSSKYNHIPIEGLEPWQADALLNDSENATYHAANACLINIDTIVPQWLKTLTADQWSRIAAHQSLRGIPLPPQWIKVWRFIVKNPNLRNADRVTRGGKGIGSYTHLWNIWSEDLLKQYTTDLEKELIQMMDNGFLYAEIGDSLFSKYGQEFWKQRKSNSTTTLAQVVNNFLYWRIPNKIARSELTDICLQKLKTAKRVKKPIEVKRQYFTYN